MNIRAIAFTEKGQGWQEKLDFPVTRGVPVMQWAREAFADADALLFIGACGIAVRAIAPLCRNKAADPAVLVMDEMGRHVIPILSGHIGGANDLALLLAERTGAEPVLTTATDVRGVPAIDSWAMKNDCAIENKAAIQAVSAGGKIGRRGDYGTGDPPAVSRDALFKAADADTGRGLQARHGRGTSGGLLPRVSA